MKERPCRSCIVCGNKKTKNELVRIVKTPSGDIILDTTGRANGRGAYVCRSSECIKALKKGALNRAFKMQLPDAVFDRLEKDFKELQTDG